MIPETDHEEMHMTDGDSVGPAKAIIDDQSSQQFYVNSQSPPFTNQGFVSVLGTEEYVVKDLQVESKPETPDGVLPWISQYFNLNKTYIIKTP